MGQKHMQTAAPIRFPGKLLLMAQKTFRSFSYKCQVELLIICVNQGQWLRGMRHGYGVRTRWGLICVYVYLCICVFVSTHQVGSCICVFVCICEYAPGGVLASRPSYKLNHPDFKLN